LVRKSEFLAKLFFLEPPCPPLFSGTADSEGVTSWAERKCGFYETYRNTAEEKRPQGSALPYRAWFVLKVQNGNETEEERTQKLTAQIMAESVQKAREK
jgi:hypothetical protein